jgi:hypothetical protein
MAILLLQRLVYFLIVFRFLASFVSPFIALAAFFLTGLSFLSYSHSHAAHTG